MFDTGIDIPILSVKTYAPLKTYTLLPSIQKVKFGDTLSYTVTAAEATTVTMSDTKGGTFTPSSFELNEGNDYTATVTYTPTLAGVSTVTADFSTLQQRTGEVLVQPYTTSI
jgi:plastocyanin